MDYTIGRPFHGEFTSADAHALNEANSRLALYPTGSTTAYSLASNEQVVITDIFIFSGAALTVTVYDGADTTVAGGETIVQGNFGANTTSFPNFNTPHYCQQGTWPKVKTSAAGQIDVYIHGIIIRNGQ